MKPIANPRSASLKIAAAKGSTADGKGAVCGTASGANTTASANAIRMRTCAGTW